MARLLQNGGMHPPCPPDPPPSALAAFLDEARAPLNAILAFSDLLADDPHIGAGPERLQRWSGLINSAARHLLALVGTVPAGAPAGPGGAREADLAELADEVLLWLHPQARHAGVTIERGAISGRVRGDSGSVQRVLNNLLSNAIRHNRPQGAVGLQARVSAGEPPQVLIDVTDSGPGLSPGPLQQLARPVPAPCAAAVSAGAPGIGLGIVRALVAQLGGTLEVSTCPGLGSRFRVTLPAAVDRSAAAPADDRIDDRADGGGGVTAGGEVTADAAAGADAVARAEARAGAHAHADTAGTAAR